MGSNVDLMVLMIIIIGIAGSLLFFYRVLNGLGLILQKDGRNVIYCERS